MLKDLTIKPASMPPLHNEHSCEDSVFNYSKPSHYYSICILIEDESIGSAVSIHEILSRYESQAYRIEDLDVSWGTISTIIYDISRQSLLFLIADLKTNFNVHIDNIAM